MLEEVEAGRVGLADIAVVKEEHWSAEGRRDCNVVKVQPWAAEQRVIGEHVRIAGQSDDPRGMEGAVRGVRDNQ
jgi:hypothetical protein